MVFHLKIVLAFLHCLKVVLFILSSRDGWLSSHVSHAFWSLYCNFRILLYFINLSDLSLKVISSGGRILFVCCHMYFSFKFLKKEINHIQFMGSFFYSVSKSTPTVTCVVVIVTVNFWSCSNMQLLTKANLVQWNYHCNVETKVCMHM